MDWDYGVSLLSYILNALRDILFVILCVSTIDSEKPYRKWRRPVSIAILVLSSILSLRVGDAAAYFGASPITESDLLITIVRAILRFGSYFLYLRTLKRISLKTSLYDACFLSAVCIIVHNLFLTPITRPIVVFSVRFVANSLANKLLCILILNIFSLFLYWMVYRFIPLGKIKNVDRTRSAMMLFFLFVSLYLNGTMKLMSYLEGAQRIQFSIYTLLLHLFLLLALYFLERYYTTVREQSRILIENRAMRSLVDSIQQRRESNELIRQLRHDLNNHLISLRYLIADNKNQEALEYISGISSQYVVFRQYIHTEIPILDAIMMQKADDAKAANISLSVSADFSHIRPITDTDLCILFGNLLDNAIEASRKVDPDARFINIHSSVLGEVAFYTIENSYSGELTFSGQLPVTTKKDQANHGIGLSAVRRIVNKYRGTITFSGKDDVFSAVISFPVPLVRVSD